MKKFPNIETEKDSSRVNISNHYQVTSFLKKHYPQYIATLPDVNSKAFIRSATPRIRRIVLMYHAVINGNIKKINSILGDINRRTKNRKNKIRIAKAKKLDLSVNTHQVELGFGNHDVYSQPGKTKLSRKEYFILYWTVLFYEDTKDNYYLAEEFIARFFGFLFEDDGNVNFDKIKALPAPQKEFIEKYLSDREKMATDEDFRNKCIADREEYSGKDLNKYFTLDEAELNEADTEFRALKEANYKF